MLDAVKQALNAQAMAIKFQDAVEQIAKLEARIKELEAPSQEPIGYFERDEIQGWMQVSKRNIHEPGVIPLYAHPAPSQEPVVTEAMVQAGKHIADGLITANVCKQMNGLGGGASWQEYQNRGVPNFDLIDDYVHDKIDSVTAIYLAMERAKIAELERRMGYWRERATSQLEQVAKLEAERDEWKDSAINGGNAGYLREQIAKLEFDLSAEQQENADKREQIGKLEARINELDGQLCYINCPNCGELAGQNESIINKKLAAAEKDAERYRWLRCSSVGPSQIWELLSDDCQPPYMTLKSMHDLDAAIDAAMKLSPGDTAEGE